MKLEWKCCECREIVEGGDGHITVNHLEINQTREWRKARSEGFYSAIELFGGPGPARWKIYHMKCDPNPDTASEYWIGITAINTSQEFLDTTAHLLEKGWLQFTDWYRVVRIASMLSA